MTPAAAQSILFRAWLRAFAEKFTGTVSEWAESGNIEFREPGKKGRFSFYGREYLRDELNCYGIEDIHHLRLCHGTRTGKTTIMFAGAAFRLWEKSRRCLNVHPASQGPAGAENIAKTRFNPMLRASPAFADLIPQGARGRYDFTNSQQILRNGSIADWVGSNSVGQLASNSMEDVYLDETDKFNVTRRRDEHGHQVEANACQLAFERTIEYPHPKCVGSSTPTLADGWIWTELLKTDLQRRFIPCPLCGRDHPSSRMMVVVWSHSFTVLPKVWGYGAPYEPNSQMPIAFVRWDDEARRSDGSWDYERVEKSAGYVCPHCNGRFQDDSKIWMDKNGIWMPTQRGTPNSRGHHLPSWYASHEQTSAGKLALEFLDGIRSLEGPRNFINSKCAEPYAGQDTGGNRVELIREAQIEITAEWHKVLTADIQHKWPYIWYVLRAWNGGDSEGLLCGHLDTFDELRSLQLTHNIPNAGVIVDSGYGAMEGPEVYRECAKYGEIRHGKIPLVMGWLPSKGFPTEKRWLDPATKHPYPWSVQATDPYRGTTDAGKCEINVFWFASTFYEGIFQRLKDKDAKHGFKWGVSPEMDKAAFKDGSTYWRHIDSKKWNEKTRKWERRSKWDHLRDCEVAQVAYADFSNWFDIKKIA